MHPENKNGRRADPPDAGGRHGAGGRGARILAGGHGGSGYGEGFYLGKLSRGLNFSPGSLPSSLRAPLALCPSGRLKGQAP